MFDLVSVEERECGVSIFEVVVDTSLDQVVGQHASCRVESRNGSVNSLSSESVLHLGSKTGLALVVSQFGDDFCARTLGTLLLRNSEICAFDTSSCTVATSDTTITLDLATMAAIAGPLYGSHC